MTQTYRHDPVSAISEAEATGETAEIFADIRTTMQIPFLTSIWRTLVGVEGGLRASWNVAKPVFETGQPEAALLRLATRASFPVPPPPDPGAWSCTGVSAEEWPVIRAIIEAYNRSNGLNFLALTGLVVEPAGRPANDPVPVSPPPWPALPDLPTRVTMAVETWTLLEQINRFGAHPDQPGLATLWRHLAHWPGLLALMHTALAPLQEDGTIQESIQTVLHMAQIEGARLALLRPKHITIPEPARAMIAQYVLHAGLVARMVAIGHGLSQWLQPDLPG